MRLGRCKLWNLFIDAFPLSNIFILSLVSLKAFSRVIRIIIFGDSFGLCIVDCFKVFLELDHEGLLRIKPRLCLSSRDCPGSHARIDTSSRPTSSIFYVDTRLNYLHIVKLKLFYWHNLSIIGVRDFQHFFRHNRTSASLLITFIVRVHWLHFSARILILLSRQFLWVSLKFEEVCKFVLLCSHSCSILNQFLVILDLVLFTRYFFFHLDTFERRRCRSRVLKWRRNCQISSSLILYPHWWNNSRPWLSPPWNGMVWLLLTRCRVASYTHSSASSGATPI